ncbi:hypothetical protein D3C86_2027590 [compost metagenome]
MPSSTARTALLGDCACMLVLSASCGRLPKLDAASWPCGSLLWQLMQAPWYRRRPWASAGTAWAVSAFCTRAWASTGSAAAFLYDRM